MFGADIFQRFCTNLHLREKVMNQFLHFVAPITFFCMSAKHNVSGQSTFYTALKTLEKSTHFMLTHVGLIVTSQCKIKKYECVQNFLNGK